MASKIGLNLYTRKSFTPGVVTSNLVLKHNYTAGSVVPVSDGAAFFDGTNDYIALTSAITLSSDSTPGEMLLTSGMLF